MYSKIREFESDIHIYEFNPKEKIFTLTGETKRTPLSQITHDYWDAKGKACFAKVNAGYFGWGEFTDTVGVDYRDEGFVFSDTVDGDEFMELVYEDKRLKLFDGTISDIKARFPKAEWAISLGYTLVENGFKSIRKADRFTHSYQSHPRTMIGQKADGNILLVVAEGRTENDKGLTANEQADVMIRLGCVTAVNADGGGSSEMIVNQEIMNQLTSERPIATALMVYGDPVEVEEPVLQIPDITVVGNVWLQQNFTLKEFACRHCGKVIIANYRMGEISQLVRTRFGVPMKIVGYRCPEYNSTIVGADPNSLHTKGLAVDISSSQVPPVDIWNYVKQFNDIKGLGIYSGHVHFDFRIATKRVEWDRR